MASKTDTETDTDTTVPRLRGTIKIIQNDGPLGVGWILPDNVPLPANPTFADKMEPSIGFWFDHSPDINFLHTKVGTRVSYDLDTGKDRSGKFSSLAVNIERIRDEN